MTHAIESGILLVSYILGSIPFAFIVCRLYRGIDIRRHGSGNVGATNVIRVVGPVPGILVGILDAAKGWIAVEIAFQALPSSWWLPIAAGMAAIVGHNWPVWLGFRGGRGVLTTAGAFINLAWLPLLCAVGVFGVVFGMSRYVSLGSMAGAVTFPLFILLIPGAWNKPAIFWVGILLAAFIIIRHIPNIRRLVRGKEHGFSRKRRGHGRQHG